MKLLKFTLVMKGSKINMRDVKLIGSTRELSKKEQILDVKGRTQSIFELLKDGDKDEELTITDIDYMSLYDYKNKKDELVNRIVISTKSGERYYTATERIYDDLAEDFELFKGEDITITFFLSISKGNGQPFLNYYMS